MGKIQTGTLFRTGTVGVAVALGCLQLAGCGKREVELDEAPSVVARVKLESELLYVDSNGGVVHAVNVMSKHLTATASRIDIPARPTLALARPASSEALVLCSGEQDANGEWLEKPALVAINTKHAVRRYELTVPLSNLQLTTDGKYAVAYGPDKNSASSELLSNPNRVALIDLEASPSSSNPVERTLKAPGGALSSVVLTEPLNVTGTNRPFGLFTFGDGLSVWDLSHPERPEIASEGLGAGGTVSLRRTVADAPNGTLYLIQSGITDLRVLALNNPSTGKDNDYWPSWNQLPLDSSSANDLMLYDEAGAPRVIVAVGSEVRIIDSNNSRVVPISVTSRIDNFYSFDGVAPGDTKSRKRLLGWSPNSNAVTFIEFADLESRGTRNMEVLQLGNTLLGVVPLSLTKLLTKFKGGGIGTLDLESRRFTPLSSSVELTAPLIESDAHRVWVGATSDDRVGYFDPSSLETGYVRLDAPIQQVFLFESGQNRKIVVSHDNPFGQMTVFDAATPSRATATVMDGFLLDGLVNR